MSLFSRAATFLNRAMKDVDPHDVVYTRGATSLSFVAWIGRTVFASNRQNSVRVEFGEIDFFIEPSDLAGLAEPKEGDRLVCTLGGSSMTFEIMAIPNEPAWRYSDPQRTRFRVHMKRVKNAV